MFETTTQSSKFSSLPLRQKPRFHDSERWRYCKRSLFQDDVLNANPIWIHRFYTGQPVQGSYKYIGLTFLTMCTSWLVRIKTLYLGAPHLVGKIWSPWLIMNAKITISTKHSPKSQSQKFTHLCLPCKICKNLAILIQGTNPTWHPFHHRRPCGDPIARASCTTGTAHISLAAFSLPLLLGHPDHVFSIEFKRYPLQGTSFDIPPKWKARKSKIPGDSK